LVLVGRE